MKKILLSAVLGVAVVAVAQNPAPPAQGNRRLKDNRLRHQPRAKRPRPPLVSSLRLRPP